MAATTGWEEGRVLLGVAPEPREAGLLPIGAGAGLLALGGTEGEPVRVPLPVVLWLGVWLLEPVPEGLLLGLAPLLRVEAADGLWLELWLKEEEALLVVERARFSC